MFIIDTATKHQMANHKACFEIKYSKRMQVAVANNLKRFHAFQIESVFVRDVSVTIPHSNWVGGVCSV